ncbi:flippase, partial [Candidatus Pacearchaeota archaeon]|nr:flippase [Candidatus Pacearchaeota archaeon]
LYRILIARSFGPEEYGLFSLATMVVILFVSLASLGIPEGLVRFIALYRGNKNVKKIGALVKSALGFLIFTSVVTSIALIMLTPWISLNLFHTDKLIPYLYLAALAIPFYTIANVYLSVLRAFEKIASYSFILNFMQNFTKIAALAIFVFFGMKINAIMFSYVLGILAMFLAAFVAVKVKLAHNLKVQKGGRGLNPLREIFSYSWPLSLLSVASFILYWVDSFTIGYFRNPVEVGLYNVAVPLAAIVMIVPDLIIQLFFPLVTKEYSRKNYSLIQELSKQATKWVFLVNVPLTLIILLFPGVIINFFFGSTYLAAEQSLQLLTLGSLFGSLSIIPAHLISMIGKSKLMLGNTLAMLALNVVLNILLVPRYGMAGAAFSTMVIFICISIIYGIQCRKFLAFIPVRRKMIEIFFFSLIPLLIVIGLKSFLILTPLVLIALGIVFLLIYAAIIWIFKCLDHHDIYIIRIFLQKLKIPEKQR